MTSHEETAKMALEMVIPQAGHDGDRPQHQKPGF